MLIARPPHKLGSLRYDPHADLVGSVLDAWRDADGCWQLLLRVDSRTQHACPAARTVPWIEGSLAAVRAYSRQEIVVSAAQGDE